MVNLLALVVIPLIGILLGFDAINSERTSGTLSRLIAQPIYRDNVINAKFVAGITTIVMIMGAIILIVAGYGLRMIGVTPAPEEASRLVFYFIFAVVYGGFWLALSMLFSLTFRSTAGSILTTIGLWLFFVVFFIFLVPLIANNVVPITSDSTLGEAARNMELRQTISRFSPAGLFTEASSTLVAPSLGANIFLIVSSAGNYFIPNPLSLSQSLLLLWPQLTGLIALTAVVFAVSYVVFMRQEIRST
jgi:ABC-2 type transport system permease protein